MTSVRSFSVEQLEARRLMSAQVWTIGGPDYERATDVAVDRGHNRYVAGTFLGTVDFDPGPGVLERSTGSDRLGLESTFIAKYSEGGVPLWVRVAGAVSHGGDVHVVLDRQGNVIVSGYYDSEAAVDFDSGPGRMMLGRGQFRVEVVGRW